MSRIGSRGPRHADLCRINAPADLAAGPNDSREESASPLGLVPHQLRGQLGQWRTLLIEGAAYDRCTGCSQIVYHLPSIASVSCLVALRIGMRKMSLTPWKQVVDAYKKEGFPMLLRAFNETDFLEKLTGLDKLHAESEAMLEQLEWEEGSEEDF